MPTVSVPIVKRLVLLLLSASLSACAVPPRPPAAVVLPPVVQPLPKELMQSESSEDYSLKVQSWLRRVADALESLQRK